MEGELKRSNLRSVCWKVCCNFLRITYFVGMMCTIYGIFVFTLVLLMHVLSLTAWFCNWIFNKSQCPTAVKVYLNIDI